MTYDHNGNILTLERKQRKYDDLTASYTNETIDNLTYAYKSADKNSLEKVTDAALTAGFDNGASSTNNDYTYDANGNLLSDKNKGIDSIKYNFLGKPVRMKFSDGKVITYVYDATGMKLTQKLYHGDTLKNTTDYVNGFVYENGALSFFGSPEGRVVKKGSNLEYEYAIADHQGNTRVVFTSVTPEADEPGTGFETSTNEEFIGYTNRSGLTEMNHTASGTYSQLLHGGHNAQVGAAKTIHVYPGDTITAEVYAKYRNVTGTAGNLAGFAAALTGAFGVSAVSTGEALNAYNSLNDFGGMIAAGDRDDDDASPKGFITIMLFDKNHNFLDAAWDQIDEDYEQTSTPPAKDPFDYLVQQMIAREEGYAYVFVSNENPTKVDIHFDDLKITHTKTNVIQYSEFYPFGLSASTSWTRENTTDNKYLYNAANELNKTTGWYEMYYRGYDPVIGRMLQVDPYATMYASQTTYNYAVNNPVMINDPNGGQAQAPPGVSQMGWERYQKINSMNDPNYLYMWSESIGQGYGWDYLSGGSRTSTGDLWSYNGRQILLNGSVVGYSFSGAAAQFVFGIWKKGLDQGFITTSDGNTAIMLFDNRPQFPSSNPVFYASTGTELYENQDNRIGKVVVKHDNYLERIYKKTDAGATDIIDLALITYDESGKFLDLELARKTSIWIPFGWYNGPNPASSQVDEIILSDLSRDMFTAIVEAIDFHCGGCVLGPVMVPLDGSENRLNATSSGSTSQWHRENLGTRPKKKKGN
jgi:RHS repeat-associated protein